MLLMLLLVFFIIFLLFVKIFGDFIDGNIILIFVCVVELKVIYGFDQLLLICYFYWLGQLLCGDLGFLLQYQILVSQLFNQYIWNFFLLVSVVLVFYWGIGLVVGVVFVLCSGFWFDYLVSVVVFVVMLFFIFFFCLLLIKWFVVDFYWLLVGGMINIGSDESGWQYVLQVVVYLVLLVLVLVMLQVGSLMCYVCVSMFDVVKMDFICIVCVKGLQECMVIFKYVLCNVLLLIIILLGFELLGLFFGVIIIEKVFNWLGVGYIYIDLLVVCDYLVLMGFILFLVVLMIVGNLFVDVLYVWVDLCIWVRL